MSEMMKCIQCGAPSSTFIHPVLTGNGPSWTCAKCVGMLVDEANAPMSEPKTAGQVAHEAHHYTGEWRHEDDKEMWEQLAQAVLAHAAAQGNGWQQPPAWLAGIDQSDIVAVFEAAQRNLPPPPQKAAQ